MAIGISNITNVTLENITKVANVTDPVDFWLNVNHVVYADYLYFPLMLIGAIILFYIAQKGENQPLHNIMYSFGIISVVAFFLRAIQGVWEGNYIAMLTDYQLWVFGLITAITAGWIWATKKD